MHPRDEHLGALGDRDRLGDRAARAGRRPALLQPGAGAAARRGRPRELSSDGTVDAAFAFAQRIGKEPIRARDTPGFVVNRILIPTLIDAVRVLDEGTASAEDIDAGMKLGTGWPIGPLALIDLIGVDVTVHAAEAMWRGLRRPAVRAARDARASMLEAGQLGRKSGRGFYSYDEGA